MDDPRRSARLARNPSLPSSDSAVAAPVRRPTRGNTRGNARRARATPSESALVDQEAPLVVKSPSRGGATPTTTRITTNPGKPRKSKMTVFVPPISQPSAVTTMATTESTKPKEDGGRGQKRTRRKPTQSPSEPRPLRTITSLSSTAAAPRSAIHRLSNARRRISDHVHVHASITEPPPVISAALADPAEEEEETDARAASPSVASTASTNSTSLSPSALADPNVAAARAHSLMDDAFAADVLGSPSRLSATAPRTSPLVQLPAELYIHHIIPYLPLSSVFSLSHTNHRLHSMCRASLSYAHPVARYLYLPTPFYVLSFQEWNENLLLNTEVRRNWLRTLSKQKKFVPLEYQEEVKLIVSSVVGESIQQRTADQAHLTSMLYRSFSIILGMYDRTRDGILPNVLPDGEVQPPRVMEIPDNMKWIQRALGSPHNLITNEQLLPSIIRSLFWIQKEKFNKRRLVLQVENVFLAIPPMLTDMAPENIRRFIKGLSDEARMIKQRLLQAAAGQPEEPNVGVPLVPGLAGGVAAFPPGEMANPNLNPVPAPLPADNQLPGRNGPPNAADINNVAATNPAVARRVFEPIRIAVMVSSETATLYPHCFNAQTLATIIRNTFNLVAWGFPHADIKYSIYMLCMSIMRDLDLDRAELLDGSTCRSSREKLQSIVSVLSNWIPTVTWDLARDTLIDIRDLFDVHIKKTDQRKGIRGT